MQLAERRALSRQGDLAAGNARDVQQVINQACELRQLPFDNVPRQAQLRILQRLHAHQMHGVANWGERVAQLVRQHREELILVAVGFLQGLFRSRPLAHLALQREIGLLQVQVGALQRRVEHLQFPRFLRQQRGIRLGQAFVRFSQVPIQIAELATLAIQLHEHRDLAAQDLGHDRYRDVINRADLVAP